MTNYHDFAVGLEALREDKKITIIDLTKGIMSRRNYTRLLNEETEVNFYTLDKLLQRMDVNISDFIHYLTNRVISENESEITFIMAIVAGQSEEANTFYKELKTKECKTIFREYSIPLGLLYLECLNKIKDKDICAIEARKIFPLKEIVDKPIVQDDVITALDIFSKLCNNEEKEQIVEFAYQIFKGEKYKMLTTFYEFSLTTLYINAINLLATKDDMDEKHNNMFSFICKDYLKFLYRAKNINYDVMFFSLMHKYNKDHDIKNDLVTFYYVVSVLSYLPSELPEGDKYEISKDDLDIFNKYLYLNETLNLELYEGVFSNDLL